MNIYSICQNNVIHVTPDTTVKFVAELMKEKNIGCVVVAENNKPVGIVTDRDFAIRGGHLCEEEETRQIREIMTENVRTIRKDTDFFDAIQEMKSSGVRRLPVVDMGGRLVGLITLDDLIRVLARELGDIARIIGKESPKI